MSALMCACCNIGSAFIEKPNHRMNWLGLPLTVFFILIAPISASSGACTDIEAGISFCSHGTGWTLLPATRKGVSLFEHEAEGEKISSKGSISAISEPKWMELTGEEWGAHVLSKTNTGAQNLGKPPNIIGKVEREKVELFGKPAETISAKYSLAQHLMLVTITVVPVKRSLIFINTQQRSEIDADFESFNLRLHAQFASTMRLSDPQEEHQ